MEQLKQVQWMDWCLFISTRYLQKYSGIREAQEAGKTLKQNGYRFDMVYTSVLTRAIQTFNYLADELNCHYIPITKNWRLNERHYGALQGLNKSETAAKHGE